MAGRYYNRDSRRRRKSILPALLTVLAAILCVAIIILIVLTISDRMDQKHTDPTDSTPNTTVAPTTNAPTTVPPTTAEPTEPPVPEEAQKLMDDAAFIAAGYDYEKAIAMLEASPYYAEVPQMADAVAQYRELDSQLVVYDKPHTVTHVFFHSLIVDTDRAFDGDSDSGGYNMYMTTVDEFIAMMESMYERGFVLVTPYDIAYEVTDETGTHFVRGEIRLPEGKTPFIMSQDDVNYYSYMISSGNGKNETPYWADHANDGFASKIVIGEDGYPTCEYVDADGNVLYGNYDLVPLLESFIQEHPDFAYHGARAVLGVTGYEGVLGYRTKPKYKNTIGLEKWQKEVDEAKKVVACLKEKGWIMASHSYGHPAYGNISAERVEADSSLWEDTCQPIIGDTDIILYPHGSDIADWHKYDFSNAKFNALYEDGYRYFFNVDSAVAWTQITEHSYRGGRRNIDGIRMIKDPEMLDDLFDVASVIDPARPKLIY